MVFGSPLSAASAEHPTSQPSLGADVSRSYEGACGLATMQYYLHSPSIQISPFSQALDPLPSLDEDTPKTCPNWKHRWTQKRKALASSEMFFRETTPGSTTIWQCLNRKCPRLIAIEQSNVHASCRRSVFFTRVCEGFRKKAPGFTKHGQRLLDQCTLQLTSLP
jgi:hypothetical protein